MNPPPIRPRDMLAIELERDRFDAEASRERWRRVRAERALGYAHRWCGGLMAVVVILGMALGLMVMR